MIRTTKRGITFDVLYYPCNFDQNMCNWKTDHINYDWFLTNGEYGTYEGYLGPDSDVTSVTSITSKIFNINS